MDKGWSINISELSGHLLYNLYSDNVDLNHENGSSILFPKANANIKIIPLLTGKIVLDKLLVQDTEIRLIVDNSSNDSIIEKVMDILSKIISEKHSKCNLENLPKTAAFFSEKNEVIDDSYKLRNKEFISIIPPIGGG